VTTSPAAVARPAGRPEYAHLAAVPAGGVMIAVAHGLVLRAAVDELAGRGVVVVDGPAPHLGNAEWVEVRVRGATRPATSA
jgi:hypothetical protein